MVIFEAGTRNIIENPDTETGRVSEEYVGIRHIYAVDHEEIMEEYVIAEYPETGGVDIGFRVASPEIGHWETVYDDGTEAIGYDGAIDDNWPHDEPVNDMWLVGVYRKYTADELRELNELKAMEAKEAAFTEALPSTVESIDDAICDLYETTLSQSGVMDEQDAAICTLYEMIGE